MRDYDEKRKTACRKLCKRAPVVRRSECAHACKVGIDNHNAFLLLAGAMELTGRGSSASPDARSMRAAAEASKAAVDRLATDYEDGLLGIARSYRDGMEIARKANLDRNLGP
jgi:hypothetical protein